MTCNSSMLTSEAINILKYAFNFRKKLIIMEEHLVKRRSDDENVRNRNGPYTYSKCHDEKYFDTERSSCSKDQLIVPNLFTDEYLLEVFRFISSLYL